MGYSSDENSDDSSTVSIDITDIKPPTIKFLPATVDELSKRFNELFIEFIRQKKHEHRNELVFLLDELLRQEAIDRDGAGKLRVPRFEFSANFRVLRMRITRLLN